MRPVEQQPASNHDLYLKFFDYNVAWGGPPPVASRLLNVAKISLDKDADDTDKEYLTYRYVSQSQKWTWNDGTSGQAYPFSKPDMDTVGIGKVFGDERRFSYPDPPKATTSWSAGGTAPAPTITSWLQAFRNKSDRTATSLYCLMPVELATDLCRVLLEIDEQTKFVIKVLKEKGADFKIPTGKYIKEDDYLELFKGSGLDPVKAALFTGGTIADKTSTKKEVLTPAGVAILIEQLQSSCMSIGESHTKDDEDGAKRNAASLKRPNPFWFRGHVGAYHDLIYATGMYCAYCECKVSDGAKFHIEHRLPKSIFPTQRLEWGNFLICCPCCNTKKGDNPDWAKAYELAVVKRGYVQNYSPSDLGKGSSATNARSDLKANYKKMLRPTDATGSNVLTYAQMMDLLEQNYLWPNQNHGDAANIVNYSLWFYTFKMHARPEGAEDFKVVNPNDAMCLDNYMPPHGDAHQNGTVRAVISENGRSVVREVKIEIVKNPNVPAIPKPAWFIGTQVEWDAKLVQLQDGADRMINMMQLNFFDRDPNRGDYRIVGRTMAWFAALDSIRHYKSAMAEEQKIIDAFDSVVKDYNEKKAKSDTYKGSLLWRQFNDIVGKFGISSPVPAPTDPGVQRSSEAEMVSIRNQEMIIQSALQRAEQGYFSVWLAVWKYHGMGKTLVDFLKSQSPLAGANLWHYRGTGYDQSVMPYASAP